MDHLMKLTLSPVISVAEFRKRKAEVEERQKASRVEKATAVLKLIDKEIKHQLLSEGKDHLSFSVLNTLINTNKELDRSKDQRTIAAIEKMVVEELRQGGWLVQREPDYRIVIAEPLTPNNGEASPSSLAGALDQASERTLVVSEGTDLNLAVEAKVSELRGIHDRAPLPLKDSLE